MGQLSRVELGSSSLTLVDLAGAERMSRCPAALLRQPEDATDIRTKKVSPPSSWLQFKNGLVSQLTNVGSEWAAKGCFMNSRCAWRNIQL